MIKVLYYNIILINNKKQQMKKTIFLFLIAFAILFNQIFAQPFSGGSGSASDPYKITSRADMEALADSVNNGDYWSREIHFKLMNDITDSVRTIIGFTPQIFAGIESKEFFEGVFDGNNKKITLAIHNAQSGSTGMFGKIGRYAVIKNVEVEGYVIATVGNPMPAAGGIAGVSLGKIENCINKCNVSITDAPVGDHAGGIVGMGYGYGQIINCVNFGRIEVPFHDVGGIAGSFFNIHYYYDNPTPIISNCINFGSVYARFGSLLSMAGGIVGQCDDISITNCINMGNVYGYGEGVGGIVGFGQPTIINRCINAGFISGTSIVGGIIGQHHRGRIQNSINIGVVASHPCNSANYIGGICGGSNSGDISNCYYDKQLCIYGGIGNEGMGQDFPGRAVGKLTSEMIGTQLQAILGTADWRYGNNLYPILKDFIDNKLCEIARSPVHFYHQGMQYETHNELYNDFTMNLENNVRWTNAFDMVTISGDQGTLNKIGRDTLYAGKRDTFRLTADKYVVMDARKTVPVRSIDSFLLTLYPNPEEGGNVQGAGKYINETLVTVRATANECYHFVNWTDSLTDEVVSWDAIYTFCFPANDLTLIANFVRDSFDLVLKINPENAGIVSGSGRFACGADTFAIIEAQELGCYKFVNWLIEPNLNVFSSKQKDTIRVTYNMTLIANFVKPEILTSSPNLLEFGEIISNFSYSKEIKLENKINQTLTIKTAELKSGTKFRLETELADKQIQSLDNITAQISVKSNIAEELFDTLLIVVFYFDCEDSLLVPIRATTGNVIFTIRAAEHKLIDPRETNYPIPIYITADKNIPDFTIDSLIIAIDKNIFYLRRVDEGILESNNNGVILLRNIKVPTLITNEEAILLNLFGDIIVSNDSSDILLEYVNFIEELTEKPELKHGYITLDICKEGGDRLLTSIGETPQILINDNPASDILVAKCKVIESGKYSLEMVDVLGKTELIKEWFVNINEETKFEFNIPVIMYGNGSYLLILNTPTTKYSEKFIIQR